LLQDEVAKLNEQSLIFARVRKNNFKKCVWKLRLSMKNENRWEAKLGSYQPVGSHIRMNNYYNEKF
tara:strand:+ start:296 stop:493 length:198 start_codon:yes stop_codon:yes gene_type:complete